MPVYLVDLQLGNGDVSVADSWMKEDTAVSGDTGDGPSFVPAAIGDAERTHKLGVMIMLHSVVDSTAAAAVRVQ